MNHLDKHIIPINIENELKNSYLNYAMSVIINRALPDVRDGLKPVHRCILIAMKVLNNTWNRPYKKSARIVGDVIGKYHPHGDSAIYETIVRMAQSFSLRYMLIDGQGNFGSIDGDSAAAMRYTEIRMSKIANELLLDIEKNTVNYISNYDNTDKIPEIMPTRIPNILINGSSGIAVGMATNIPPHNLVEVINGCIAYIDNENITIKQLMKYIPGPDFPTSGIINGSSGIENAYITGKGKIYIRAKTIIENNNKNNKKYIVIKEIPYQVNKSHLIKKISELVKTKRINGIKSVRDESDKDGLRIVIDIKKDFICEIVLNNLYKLTELQISFGINMVALTNGKPKLFSLKDILSSFINHRKEIITRRTMFDLEKIRSRVHILEALAIALNNIKLIINLIQKSNSPIIAKSKLINKSWDIGNNILKKFNLLNKNKFILKLFNSNINIKNKLYHFTEIQAEAILNLRLQKLTNLEFKKIFFEYKNLIFDINNLLNILKSNDLLINVIKKELILLKTIYCEKRRTKIYKNIISINTEDLIHKEDVVITLSHFGYVKNQPLSDYEAQRRGGKGKLAAGIKKEDFIEKLLVANSHDTILLFSSRGRMYWMKVYELPESSRIARGKPIVNLLPLDKNERITAILPVRKYKKGFYVFMATSIGIVKKTELTEFSRPRSRGIIAINLSNNDELIGVDLTNGKNEVMLFSSYGKVIRFKENQVRNMGRTAIGVKGINLFKLDKVVSLIIPRGSAPILTITQYGYGKRTKKERYPINSRGVNGVISIKVNKRNGEVVNAVQAENSDQILIITNFGNLVRIRVSEINIVGRNTHGVTLIRTNKNEKVVGLQRLIDKVYKKIFI